MWAFYVLILLPICVQLFTTQKHNVDYAKKIKLSLFLFFAILALIVSLRRADIGLDTSNYILYFRKRSIMSWVEAGTISIEFGFSYLNKLVSLFTDSYQLYFAIVVTMTLAMFYPTYKRLCKDTSLTIVLFCIMPTFVMLFSGIRQMLAVGIGVIAYEFARNKKIIPFIVCVLVAMSFHTSAFMLLFMYPLYQVKITKKWLIVVIPVMLIMFAFNRQIFSTLAIVLEQFTKYDASISQTGAYTMLILFSAFAVFSFIIPDESLLDDETKGLRNFLLLSVALQMFAPLHTIAMRMNYYYIIYIPLLIPKIISARRIRWDHVAILSRYIMVAFFLVYFFYNSYVGNNNLDVFPYHFFWEDVQ